MPQSRYSKQLRFLQDHYSNVCFHSIHGKGVCLHMCTSIIVLLVSTGFIETRSTRITSMHLGYYSGAFRLLNPIDTYRCTKQCLTIIKFSVPII